MGKLAALNDAIESAKKIIAWHGSPHKFDKFSMDNIGTGEGAQAYGHGLYFADTEDTARSYRDGLTVPSRIKDGLMDDLVLSDFDQVELMKALKRPPAFRDAALEPFRASWETSLMRLCPLPTQALSTA